MPKIGNFRIGMNQKRPAASNAAGLLSVKASLEGRYARYAAFAVTTAVDLATGAS